MLLEVDFVFKLRSNDVFETLYILVGP